jgi:hypothetical protein
MLHRIEGSMRAYATLPPVLMPSYGRYSQYTWTHARTHARTHSHTRTLSQCKQTHVRHRFEHTCAWYSRHRIVHHRGSMWHQDWSLCPTSMRMRVPRQCVCVCCMNAVNCATWSDVKSFTRMPSSITALCSEVVSSSTLLLMLFVLDRTFAFGRWWHEVSLDLSDSCQANCDTQSDA